MKKNLAFFTALSLFSLVLIPHTNVYSQKLSKSKPLYATDKIIVKLKKGVDAGADSILPSRSGRVEALSEGGRGRAYALELDGAVSVDEAVNLALADPRVEYAEPDYYLYPSDKTPNDTHFSRIWGLSNSSTPGADISATKAWDITTGSDDVVVAIIDSGADLSHPDLAPNAWVNTQEVADNRIDDDGNGFVDDISGWNFVAKNNKFFKSADEDYHGTHVAGTIGAAGNNSMGVTGVAWNVRLMSLKFLGGPQGKGSTSNAINAINYAIAQRKRGVNVRVINASWGGEGDSLALRDAIEEAGKAGILFVAAAGNDGGDSELIPHYPSSHSSTVSSVLSVSAMDEYDNLADFSNYGHSVVSVGAPGDNVVSTLPRSDRAPNGGYGILSGTSMATPFVSGIAVLVWAHEPELTPEQVKQRIISTSEPVPTLASKTISSGRANAYYALTNRVAPRSAPVIAYVTTDKKSITLDGFGFLKDVSVIEANGVALSGVEYDSSYEIANGTLTRLKINLGKKGMKQYFPKRAPVAITVYNPVTGERSPHYTQIR